jgi:hypothetical protein
MGADQRREFHEALLDADSFEDLPDKWQAALVAAEQNRPDLSLVKSDSRPEPVALDRAIASRANQQ